jgi:outer membrane protein
MPPVISSRRVAFIMLATLSVLASSASAAPPPTGSPAAAEGALAQPPTDAPQDGVVEGPAPPEVPEFENPIVAALQPVPGGLTSDEVARRSVEQSPAIAAKQAEVDAAKAQLEQTIYQFVPRVEGSLTYMRLSRAKLNFGGFGDGNLVGALNEGPLTYGPCAPGSVFQCILDSGGQPVGAFPVSFSVPNPPLNSTALKATLGVPISDYIARLPTAKKAGKAQIRAAEHAATAELLTTQTDARVAYFDWIRAIASKVALQESLTRTQARLEDAQAAFEAGVASKADVMRLDAAVATLTAAIIRADNYQILAEQALSLQMGEDEFPRYQIGDDLFAPEPPLVDVDNLPALIEEAEQQRYEMKAFTASTESIDNAIKTNRAGYYPRLDGFGEALYANPNQRFFPLEPVFNGSWAIGVSLTWVMNDALQASAKAKELKANQRGLDAQGEQLRRGLAMEVAAAYAERQSVLAEIEHIERATASAAEGYRVAVDLYQVGDATTTDILEAEYEQVDATLRNINAKINLRIANLKLMYATGRLQPVTTDVPPGSYK